MRSAAGVSLILLGVLACSAPPEVDSADGTWVGTITTEGDVTTVINESGSVWGGTATLAEEASIGVDLGPDEYMLGNVEGVAVTEDRIFVLDRSVPVLRVYDLEGNHLLDMGRGGPGPGEFVNPYLLAASEDGRVFVRTFSGLVVFDFDGTHLMTLMERGGIVLPMVAGNDGTLFMPVAWPGPSAFGHLPIAPDGTRGERMQAPTLVDREPWALIARAADGGYLQLSVPFSPSTVWTLAPSGAVIRASSDEYRIEVQDPAGKVLLIDRRADAVPVTDEERAWQEGVVSFRMKQVQPGWEWTANPIPASKPFFDRFYTDQDGVLWVRRILGTERMPDCDRDPLTAPEEGRPLRACFRDTEGFDVFDPDGRYRGQVEIPSIKRVDVPSIRGDTLVQAVEDEAGTIMVKRYRLVLPGER